jgi:hypothetical protein
MTVRDPELLLELRDEPELLAIADALADVLGPDTASHARRRRWIPFSSAAGVAAAAAAVLAVVLTGSNVERGLVDRALAAVGSAPVLHVVLREEAAPDTALVEIATGRKYTRPRVNETEIWFDEERGLKHTVSRINGRVLDDELATPEGTTNQFGPVWTCARIAQHPVEAKKDGVSCHLNGDNGTVPRKVPENRPSADPGLAAFVDGYRQALESGDAHQVGEGEVDGTHVYWLEFALPDVQDADGRNVTHWSERVAVASDTFRPVLVRRIGEGVPGPPARIITIESLSRDAGDFSKPALAPPDSQASWTVTASEAVTPAEASSTLGVHALWAGPRVAGLELSRIERQEVTTSYPASTEVPQRRTSAVTFVYGPGRLDGHPTRPLEIVESREPLAGWISPSDPTPPPAGFFRTNLSGWGYLRVGELHIQIREFSFFPDVDQHVLAAARQLEPVPPDG